MELFLAVDIINPTTFQVYRGFKKYPSWIHDSILKLDYNYLPWPRKEGNLLW